MPDTVMVELPREVAERIARLARSDSYKAHKYINSHITPDIMRACEEALANPTRSDEELRVSVTIEEKEDGDWLRFSPPEVEGFDEFTPKLAATTYGSAEYDEFRAGLGESLAHHYAANDHHPEHHSQGIDSMDLIQLLEMLCDWIAATRRHDDGDIHRSIDLNAERFGYDDTLRLLLHRSVGRIEDVEDRLADPQPKDGEEG